MTPSQIKVGATYGDGKGCKRYVLRIHNNQVDYSANGDHENYRYCWLTSFARWAKVEIK